MRRDLSSGVVELSAVIGCKPRDVSDAESEPRYLDLAQWSRRESFEYFRGFDKPFFNLCTRVDVAPLRAALGDRCSVIVACHWLALRLAHEIEPFCWRVEGDRIRIHPRVHASTTVLRHDESIGFARLHHHDRLADFVAPTIAAIEAARTGPAFAPLDDTDAVLHFTTLPWVHFTSFSHARHWGRRDSIPKLAFGRYQRDGDRLWMPLSVEVHHAVMDGLHAGRYVQRFEAMLESPEAWVTGL